jgi:hypothetical protein
MKTNVIKCECVYAKILALGVVYAKEESSRGAFLEKISYSPEEMTAIMNTVCDDFEFRSWIEKSIPVMQRREKVSISK